MKFKLLLISTIVFSFLISCSENKSEKNTSTSPSIQWQKSFGGYYDDVAYSIQQTSDSGYIAAGYSASNDGDVTENYGKLDIWVVKLNSAGIIRWQKTLGGSSNEQARSIQQTNDGGCIVAGYSGSNDGNIIGNKGGYDCLIVKLDPFGKILWQKSFGGAMNDYAYSIQQTNDDGYVVAGSTGS
ncbi:MAG: hypothetical protein QG635_993, partial [Bacteroidota bacterium]|nr:hypothetical protein [Bacteroidota bacterium]